jgi:hypothetical protein
MYENDPIVGKAVTALADQLSAVLVDRIRDAATEALRRIEDATQSRSGEIDAATDLVRNILDELGTQMRSGATTALTEGVRDRVLPALEAEGQKLTNAATTVIESFAGRLDQTLSTTIQSIEEAKLRIETAIQAGIEEMSASLSTAKCDLNATVVATAEGIKEHASTSNSEVSDRLGQTSAGLQQQIRDLVTQSEGAAKAAETANETTHKALVQQFQKSSAELGRLTVEAARSTEESVAKGSERVYRSVADLAATVSTFRKDTVERMERTAHEQQERDGSMTDLLRKAFADQEVRVKRLWYAQLAVATFALVTLFVVTFRH